MLCATSYCCSKNPLIYEGFFDLRQAIQPLRGGSHCDVTNKGSHGWCGSCATSRQSTGSAVAVAVVVADAVADNPSDADVKSTRTDRQIALMRMREGEYEGELGGKEDS